MRGRQCHLRTAAPLLAAAGCALALGGCLNDRPRLRIGSLPFPGFLTNYEPLEIPEPDSLGEHQYAHFRLVNGKEGPEVDHGILYTCRAGFLDLAHLRTTVDWTWYAWRRIRESLTADEWTMRFNGPDLTWWDVSFEPPSGWLNMPPDERQDWIDKVALRTGQRLAYLIQTWHEIATWHGHRISIIVPEEVSAFTYDDVMSHVVGVFVAERAIRSGMEDYDEAVTVALAETLEELGAVDSDAVRRATRLVHEDWWRGRMAGRNVDVGLDDGHVTPWLVQGLSDCGGECSPESFQLPWVGDPCGDEGRIGVDSILLQLGAIRDSAGLDDGAPLEEKDFPALLAAIRRDLAQRDNIPHPDPVH
jgi:hypothetical protein